jgi:hypothetical protein
LDWFQKLAGGLTTDLVIPELATPHLFRIRAYSPVAMSSLTASVSGLASGDPFAVTKPRLREPDYVIERAIASPTA